MPERSAFRVLALLTFVVLVLTARPAHAHSAAVGALYFWIFGAVPAVALALVHALLATLWLAHPERGWCLRRLVGATLLVVPGLFVLQFGIYALLGGSFDVRRTVSLVLALAVTLGAFALVALPLAVALKRAGHATRGRVVLAASVVAPPVLVVLLLFARA